jgi:hypothetical protein
VVILGRGWKRLGVDCSWLLGLGNSGGMGRAGGNVVKFKALNSSIPRLSPGVPLSLVPLFQVAKVSCGLGSCWWVFRPEPFSFFHLLMRCLRLLLLLLLFFSFFFLLFRRRSMPLLSSPLGTCFKGKSIKHGAAHGLGDRVGPLLLALDVFAKPVAHDTLLIRRQRRAN